MCPYVKVGACALSGAAPSGTGVERQAGLGDSTQPSGQGRTLRRTQLFLESVQRNCIHHESLAVVFKRGLFLSRDCSR